MWVRGGMILGLAGTLAVSGCHCGRKADEEILRTRVDTTSVHLYLATKIAFTKADTSPEVAEAKKQLDAAIAALRALEVAKAGPAAPSSATSAIPAVASAAPDTTKPSAQRVEGGSPPAHVSKIEYAKLAVALWKLRAQGKAIVQSGREDDLAPVLPIVLRGTGVPTETLRLFNLNAEHALFLTALFVVKFHPRSPAPVPDELLLYEAWKTDTDVKMLDGFEPFAQSMKAIVYANNELCDLAATEGVRADRGSAALASQTMNVLSGGKAPLTPEGADLLTLSARALAHGTAGICYLDRGERPKAMNELEKFVTATGLLGVPPSETALLRAYIAYENGDHYTARKCLEEARDAPGTDTETRREIERLLPHVAKNDDGALRKLYSKTSFMIFAVGLLYRQLERAGLIDALADIEVVRALRGYTRAATGALGDAKHAIPSFTDVKDRLVK